MRRTMTLVLALLVGWLTMAAGWPTDHGDNLRSGSNPSAATFRALKTAFSRTLDGAVYASPILAGGNVIVATENNTVYALDPSSGAVRWSRHLRAPVSDTSKFACSGNISPSGITSTPAYDPYTGRVFVVTVTYSSSGGVRHEIWGLNAANGSTAMNRRVEVPGTDPAAQQQRIALALGSGNVYIGFGGLAGDCGNYKGAMISLKVNGQPGGVAYVVPTPREGAMWSPGGPVVQPNGNLLVAVGNGESTSAYDYSDSITELTPGMKRVSFFAPSTWAHDNQVDADLGSLTPAYTSTGYILQAGKSGTGYTVRIGALGGIGGQKKSAPLCRAFGVSAVTGSTVYMPCTDGVSRVNVSSDGSFTKIWTAAGIPGSPVAGPGALYALGGQSGSRLYALNGRTGGVLGSVAVGNTNRFATPMLTGNKLYVGTLTGVVAVSVN